MPPRRFPGFALALLASWAAAAPASGPVVPTAGTLSSLPSAAAGPAGAAAIGAVFDGSRALPGASLAGLSVPTVAAIPSVPVALAPQILPAPAALDLPGVRLERPDAGRLSVAAPAHLQELDRSVPGSGGAVDTVPGSIFDWRPAEESPGHGFPPIDALARRLASRKDRRFDAGFVLPGSQREAARVFFYGERHTDRALIVENMRRLAEDLRRRGGGIVLDEGYLGPRLTGTMALRYLEAKGFDRAWLGPEFPGAALEVSGWEDPELYSESRTASLNLHMALYELNQLMHGGLRGAAYYRELWRKAAEAMSRWRAAREIVVGGRNGALDQNLARAIEDGEARGRSVHVIAGSEHLVESPLLVGAPLIGRPKLRHGLAEAIGSRPFWAGMPGPSSGRASAEELAFAAKASFELARLADDIGAERGVKAKQMTGADFLAIVEAGRARFAQTSAASAPSPRAFTAALGVQEHAARMARALLESDAPLQGQVGRLLSVWSVFNQEMEAASAKGAVEAIEAEAKLFADQVEESV